MLDSSSISFHHHANRVSLGLSVLPFISSIKRSAALPLTQTVVCFKMLRKHESIEIQKWSLPLLYHCTFYKANHSLLNYQLSL